MIKEILLSESVRKKLKKPKILPVEIRDKFIWSVQTLLSNPRHPSLRHKKIQGRENEWEISITMNYRAVYFLKEARVCFTAIGKHEDVF